MEEFLTVGPWGGKGGNPWSFVENNGGIIGMKIVHGDVIDSITFKRGDEYGILQNSKKVGGIGGSKTDEISFNWPEEYLTSFSGTVKNMGTLTVIHSLSFKSNKTEYGPYGTVAGQPFSYRMEGSVIVGFHGRAGYYVDAIGAYVKITPKEPDNTLKMILPVPRGPGPWGGHGGMEWDDGVFPAIRDLQLHVGDSVIHAIRVLYESKDGEPVWSPKHGGDGGKIKTIKLEVSKEFLVRIAGFYGPVKGSDSFKALRSITFYTSKAQCGPFGDEIGPKKEKEKRRLLKGYKYGPFGDEIGRKTKSKTNSLTPTCSPKAEWLKTATILMDWGNHFVTDVADWASKKTSYSNLRKLYLIF